jgi:(S)-mandelate dehydrogenase
VLYGLAARGSAGVDAVLKTFTDELVRTMTLLRAPDIQTLQGLDSIARGSMG